MHSILPNVTATKKSAQHRSRRSSRQFALQILFQEEFRRAAPRTWDAFWEGQNAATDVKTFADRLVEGVLTHQEELDRLINDYAKEWSLTRMPVVDRNILRCALFELLWISDVPAKVSINEALELAKRFADEESRRFVNGILDRIIQVDSRLEAKRAEMIQTETFSTNPSASPAAKPTL